MGIPGHYRSQTNIGLPEGEKRRVGEGHSVKANFYRVTDRQEDEKVNFQIWPRYQNP